MTTIAWDGMTLAGDKQINFDNTPVLTTKVLKVGKGKRTVLVGACGNTADCQAFRDWALNGFKGDRPQFTDLWGLVVSRDGTLTFYDENPNTVKVKTDKYAMGTGGNYAMGAMAFGANAEEAVRIAIALDTNTGLGVDTVSF